MICISIAGTKGGIGKTTTAVALGQLFAQQVGHTVIADLDLQASATAWSLEAKESGNPFDSDVRQLSPALSAARLPRSTISEVEHADVAILDTPPGVIERIDAAIEVTTALGGLTIVTTSPSALDLPRAASTIELIDNRTPVVVLLTRVRARTVSAREARQELVDYGAHVLENEIPLLEAIAGAGKTAPQPGSVLLNKYEPVAEELLDVLEKGRSIMSLKERAARADLAGKALSKNRTPKPEIKAKSEPEKPTTSKPARKKQVGKTPAAKARAEAAKKLGLPEKPKPRTAAERQAERRANIQQLNVEMSPFLRAKVDVMAAAEGKTVKQLVTDWVENYDL